MAVPISAFSVVVRNKTIDEQFSGGMLAYISLCPNQTLCTDGKVTRISFSTPADVKLFLEALAERGLTAADDKGVSVDVALVIEGNVNDYPYLWLEHGTIKGRPAAWLKGADPGELVIADEERKSSGLKAISEKELRESFDLVGTENNVEAYRNRRTGEMLYVGRTSPPVPHTLREMNSTQVAKHNRVFVQAVRLAEHEIPVHRRQYMPKPGWWARHKLRRALSLFARVLELQPGNWSAMWWVGMIHKRFEDHSTALLWFERALQVSSYQPDVAREACSCALELGRHEVAISFAVRAVEVKPDDAGLRSNLALALLLAGKVNEAKVEIERAIAQDPSDQISLGVRRDIERFAVSKEKPPSTLRGLQNNRRKAG
jgi:tetratricopeptide (TPR) repeat protein